MINQEFSLICFPLIMHLLQLLVFEIFNFYQLKKSFGVLFFFFLFIMYYSLQIKIIFEKY